MHMDIEKRVGDLLGWDALTRMAVASDDWALVTEAEAEIARRGLSEQYAVALADEVRPNAEQALKNLWYLTNEDIFAIATAPPDVRVRAMLKVLEG